MNNMNELAAQLKALRDRKDELAQAVKDNNAEIERVELELSNMMIEEGNDSFSLNGFKFSLQYKDMFSSRVEFREQLIDALKFYGYDRADIITETIPAQKFNSIMKNIYEENDETLPEEFTDIVTMYTKQGVQVRKESGKGAKSRTGKRF